MSPRDVIYEEMGEECSEPDVCQHCLKRADSILAALAKAGFKIMARDPAPAIHTAGLMAPPPKLIGPGGEPVIGWKFADELYKLHWDASSPTP